MDRKREDYQVISKLVNFVALVILCLLLAYILKALRERTRGLATEDDELVVLPDVSSVNGDETSAVSSAEQEASELAEESIETSVEALLPLPSSGSVETPAQDRPEVLAVPIEEVSDHESSVSAETTLDTAVDSIASDAYCMKCKQKRNMQNVHKIVTKNGRNALEGTCPVCSTRLFRFVRQ